MSAPTESSTPTGPSRSSRSLPRPLWFTAALLLFLISSWIAFRQEPCPNVYAHQQTNPLYADWWLRPIEINAPLRLPEVQADFNDVFALAGTGHVWAVGSGGLILHSADGGVHWEQQHLVDPKDPAADQPVTFQTTPSAPQPANKPRAAAAALRMETVPLWRRMLPGSLAESALLVSFLPEVKGPPTQQQTQSPVQQNTFEPKAEVSPPKDTTSSNSAKSDPSSRIVHFARHPDKQRTTPNRPSAKAVVAPEPQITLRALGDSNLEFVTFFDVNNGIVYRLGRAPFFTRDGGRKWELLTFSEILPAPDARLSEKLNRYDLEQYARSLAFWGSHSNSRKLRLFGNLRPCAASASIFTCSGISTYFAPWVASGLTGNRVDRIFRHYRVLTISPDRSGWLGGNRGALLKTENGGQTWRRMTRELPQASGSHHIFPAPWYYLSLLAVGLLFVPALRLPKPEEITESAADLLVSDNPISNSSADVFDFSAVALGLSRFLRNEKTTPPLTIAVTGEWGSGKSSLMNLLRVDLERYGFRPVWFNAWHHQKEENLLASLLESVRASAIPPWWRPEGAIFRGKLLKIRWLRFWPIVTLVLIAFAFSLGYIQNHPVHWDSITKVTESIPASLDDLLQWITGESKKVTDGKEADGHVPWIAFLLSSAGLLISLWKGLKGFGVNPASLLARDTGTAKVKDLENLTGFRHRFAAEFKDITRALNPRTLLILIDDLDRCRPEMVLEVLESVNFLVSSGDCFVVMGMARDRVVRCVGLSFKDVASELLVTTPSPGDEGLKPEEVARRQRIEFAQQYLEKLINIEVPVPSPTDEQSRRLMLAAGEAPEPETPESRSRFLERQAWALTRKALPFAAVASLLFLGYWIGATRIPQKPEAPAQVAQTPVPSPVQGPVAPTSTTPNPEPAKPITTAPAKVELGVESRLPLYPAVILLVLLVGLGIWRLSIPPGVVIHDSPDFEAALRTWHPLVFSYRNTPRSIKRFLNRVRYLAMLQRKQGAEPARWASFLAKVLRRPVGVPKAAEGATAQAAIPEDVLVALAAVEHCHPDYLQNNLFFAEPQSFLDPKLLPDEIRDAIPRLANYRETYFRISRGIHIS